VITSVEQNKIYCNVCSGFTNHNLLASHNADHEEAENHNGELRYVYYEKSIYKFWICNGCDTAILEDYNTNIAMIDEEGQNIYESIFWPPRKNMDIQKLILKPKFFASLRALQLKPSNIEKLYNETIKAFNYDLFILCAIGIRALLESICEKQGISDSNAFGLGQKLKILKEQKHLPENIVEGLSSLKFIGDKAAHKLIAPTKEELQLGIEIIEDILNRLYEIDYTVMNRLNKISQSIENGKKTGFYPPK
jgi:Domain of unknown function (DUF4145)